MANEKGASEAFRRALDAWRRGRDLATVRGLVREFVGRRSGRLRDLAAEQASGRPTIHRGNLGSGEPLSPDDLHRAFNAAVDDDDSELFELLFHPSNYSSAVAYLRNVEWSTSRSIHEVITYRSPNMLRVMLDFLDRLQDEDDALAAWTNVEYAFPMAVRNGNLDNVRMMLDRRAVHVDACDGGALLEAMRYDEYRADVKAIHSHVDHVEATPETMDVLLRAGADVNRRIITHDMRPLQWALEYGMPVPLLSRLLEAGADLHHRSAELLAAAIEQYDDARAFDLLVRRGARVGPEDACALLSLVRSEESESEAANRETAVIERTLVTELGAVESDQTAGIRNLRRKQDMLGFFTRSD